MPDVFISYNREDKPVAQNVATALETEGYSVWWDAALKAGEAYDEVTERNLREAKAVVVLWSKRSVNSKWVRAEATIGERHSVLVPALIEECDRPLRFELIQTGDLTQWRGNHDDPNWRSFVGDIKQAIGSFEDTGAVVSAPGATALKNAAASAAAASSPADDDKIETAFWNSIKDGSDPAEFEAYLKRYTDGHFADIAMARLAAFKRAEKQAAAQRAAASARQAATSQQARPAQQTDGQGAQAPKVQPAPRPQAAGPKAGPAQLAKQQAAQQQRKAPRRAAHPTQSAARQLEKKSSAGMLISMAIVALLAFGGGALTILHGGSGGADPKSAAPAADVLAEQTPAADTRDPGATVQRQQALEEQGQQDDVSAADADSPVLTGAAGNPIRGAVSNLNLDDLAASGASARTADGPEIDAGAAGVELKKTGAATSTEPEGEKRFFRDCDSCPQMAIIPAGSFMMGSPRDEPGRNAYEGPQTEVAVGRFAIGVHEVTREQWAACVEDGGCNGYAPGTEGFDGENIPVLNISWRDAQAYVDWLSTKSERRYRLPSEAEWEYAARGGSQSAYWWGGRFDGSVVATGAPKPVGSFPANTFGLHDVSSNVREWVEDCYMNNYGDRPADASPVVSGDCGRRVVRGGYWGNKPEDMRVANRIRISTSVRDEYLGFRVAANVD